MSLRVLLDTNVVLDVLLERQPHAGPAAQVLSLVDAGRLEGAVTATADDDHPLPRTAGARADQGG